MTIKKKSAWLASAGIVSILGLGAGSALAQDAKPIGSDGDSQVVIVKGMRSSMQKSLNTKKNADGFVDVITSEDIGKFPDVNVADSLRRVPGIATERDIGTGESNVVDIRGFGGNQNLTLINGQNLASPSGSRAFDFQILPSELVGSLKVYKSSEADLDEGGIGGTVVIDTRKPLDSKKNFLVFSAQGRDETFAKKWGQRYSVIGSWQNDSHTFGILGAISVNKFENRADFIETFEWTKQNIVKAGNVLYSGVYAPNNVNYSTGLAKVDNLGANIALQYRPSDNLELGLNVTYAGRDRIGSNQNYRFQQNYADVTAATVQNGVLTSATMNQSTAGTPGNPQLWGSDLILDSGQSHKTSSTLAIQGTVDWRHDAWTVHGVLGNSNGKSQPKGTGQVFFAFGQNTGGTFYELRNKTLIGGARNPASINLATMPLFWIQSNDSRTKDGETYAQLDVTRKFDTGFVESLKFGVKARARENSGYSRNAMNLNNGNAATPLGVYYSQIQVRTLGSEYAQGFDDQPEFPTNKPISDYRLLQQALGVQFPGSFQYPSVVPDVVKEDVLASYAKMNFRGQMGAIPVHGNLGVRVVQTDTASTSQTSLGVVTTKGSYRDILPSLNVVFDLSDHLLVRTSASRTVARPNYSDLRGTLDLNTVGGTGSGGNPSLQPLRADAIDAGIEWYPKKNTFITAAYFYKEIQNFPSTETKFEDFTNIAAGCCRVTRPITGGSGNVYGLEAGAGSDLKFLPGILQNLGWMANYTYAKSISNTRDPLTGAAQPLPGQSRNSYNATVYYEDKNISARLAYTYRDKYLGGAISGVSSLNAAVSGLDASLTWNVTDHLALRADGVNLTNARNADTYVEVNGTYLPVFQINSGRTFYLGATFSY